MTAIKLSKRAFEMLESIKRGDHLKNHDDGPYSWLEEPIDPLAWTKSNEAFWELRSKSMVQVREGEIVWAKAHYEVAVCCPNCYTADLDENSEMYACNICDAEWHKNATHTLVKTSRVSFKHNYGFSVSSTDEPRASILYADLHSRDWCLRDHNHRYQDSPHILKEVLWIRYEDRKKYGMTS